MRSRYHADVLARWLAFVVTCIGVACGADAGDAAASGAGQPIGAGAATSSTGGMSGGATAIVSGGTSAGTASTGDANAATGGTSGGTGGTGVAGAASGTGGAGVAGMAGASSTGGTGGTGTGGANADDPAARCVSTGGSVEMGLCCAGASDFPDGCLIGGCGCSPSSSVEIQLCACPDGKCFQPATGCVSR